MAAVLSRPRGDRFHRPRARCRSGFRPHGSRGFPDVLTQREHDRVARVARAASPGTAPRAWVRHAAARRLAPRWSRSRPPSSGVAEHVRLDSVLGGSYGATPPRPSRAGQPTRSGEGTGARGPMTMARRAPGGSRRPRSRRTTMRSAFSWAASDMSRMLEPTPRAAADAHGDAVSWSRRPGILERLKSTRTRHASGLSWAPDGRGYFRSDPVVLEVGGPRQAAAPSHNSKRRTWIVPR